MRKIPFLLTSQESGAILSRFKKLNAPKSSFANFYRFQCEGALIGYLQPSFVEILKKDCNHVFLVNEMEKSLQFKPVVESLSPEERTSILNDTFSNLQKTGLIKGWRNELFPVSTCYQGKPLFLLERALIPYFGVKAYGVHINGYIRDECTQQVSHLWVGRRSFKKSTWPGMLDHIVAGGLPHGISIMDNVIKECEEEGSISRDIAKNARPTGALSYYQLDEWDNLKRDVIFAFDLQLPVDFKPIPADGEVENFECHPIEWILNKVTTETSDEYKPNCNLVIVDFFIRYDIDAISFNIILLSWCRHGLIDPESPNYLELVASLRQGDLS
jgi:isopentenyldiphosphate isomerase